MGYGIGLLERVVITGLSIGKPRIKEISAYIFGLFGLKFCSI